MDQEMKHDEMHKPHMHEGHHHRPWQSSWKSPVSIGIFLLTATLSLAILLYTILNLVGVILEAAHPAAASQGMSQQELQQLMQQQAPTQGATTQ
jgi:hypothetical protein